MIKRKTKSKTKKQPIKRRRNPILDEIPLTKSELGSFWFNLEEAINYGTIENLQRALVISKVGFTCTDCERPSSMCKCEYCPDCKLNQCMCDYSLDKNSSGDDVRIAAWNFAKTILSKNELEKFYKDLTYQYRIPESFRSSEAGQRFIKRNELKKYLKENILL